MYRGLAQYHQASVHADAYEYGLQVGRLALADSLVAAAATAAAAKGRPDLARPYRETHEKVAYAHAQADKDNTTIYLEPVPPRAALLPVAPCAIVKPTPLEQLTAPLTADEDPFVQLVPKGVAAQLRAYEASAAGVVATISAEVNDAIADGERILSGLDLPWALQAVESAVEKLPQALRDAVGEAHASGGVNGLRVEADAAAALLDECAGVAGRVHGILREEAERETQMRVAHGQKWDLLASAGQAATLHDGLVASEERLVAAGDAHGGLRERVADAAATLDLLDLPVDTLVERVPHAAGSPLAQLPVTTALRTALDRVGAHGRTRDDLLGRVATVDGTTHTLTVPRDAGGAIGLSLEDTMAGRVGVRICHVDASGPSASAGLAVGDVVLRIDGASAEFHQQAIGLINERPSEPVELVVHKPTTDPALVRSLVYRGHEPAEALTAAHLSRYAPLQGEAAAFTAEHRRLLDAVVDASAAFTQARISETESQAKRDYFKTLSDAASTYAALHAAASAAVAALTREREALQTLHERASDLAADRLQAREELARRLEEEANPQRSPSPVALPSAAAPIPVSLEGLAASAAPGTLPGAPPDQALGIQRLMEMGFSRDQALGALQASAMDFNGAISLLLGLTTVPTQPPAAAPPAPTVDAARLASSGRATADDARLHAATADAPELPSVRPPVAPAAPPPPPLVRRGTSAGSLARFEVPAALPPKMRQIVDLGFSREQAAAALQAADGSVEVAIDTLLASPRTSERRPSDAGERGLSELAPAAPTVAAARAEVSLPTSPVLGELMAMGFTPELAREALDRTGGALEGALQLLLDAPEGGPLPPLDGLAHPPPPLAVPPPAAPVPAAPTATSVSAPPELSPGLADAVNQLRAMGFNDQLVRAALGAASGDRNAALNLLLDPSFEGSSAAMAAAAPAPAPVVSLPPVSSPAAPPHSASPSYRPTTALPYFPAASGTAQMGTSVLPMGSSSAPTVPYTLPPHPAVVSSAGHQRNRQQAVSAPVPQAAPPAVPERYRPPGGDLD